MPTSIGLMAATVIFALSAFVAIALLRRSPLLNVDGDDEEYQPSSLAGLLDDRDAAFVAALGDPQLLARFRAHRRAVVRTHLDQLSREFNRTSTALKRHLTEAETDRPDLLVLLMRETWAFHTAMACQRLCLALHWMGLKPSLQWPELTLARVRQLSHQPVAG